MPLRLVLAPNQFSSVMVLWWHCISPEDFAWQTESRWVRVCRKVCIVWLLHRKVCITRFKPQSSQPGTSHRLIGRLYQSGVDEQLVMEHTGHQVFALKRGPPANSSKLCQTSKNTALQLLLPYARIGNRVKRLVVYVFMYMYYIMWSKVTAVLHLSAEKISPNLVCWCVFAFTCCQTCLLLLVSRR